MFVHYLTGLTAFDFISDFEEWIECSYFNEEIKARLKGKPSIHERLSLEKPVPNFLCTCVFLFYYFSGSLSSCLRGNSKRKKARKSWENLSFFFGGGILSLLCPASMQIY